MMWKKGLMCVCFAMYHLLTVAQELSVEDVCVSMSNGLQCGISVVVPNASKEELLKSWESAVKSQSQYTVKTQKVNGELQLQSAQLKGINPRLNIYTVSYQRGEEAELITFYELPVGLLNQRNSRKSISPSRNLCKNLLLLFTKKRWGVT